MTRGAIDMSLTSPQENEITYHVTILQIIRDFALKFSFTLLTQDSKFVISERIKIHLYRLLSFILLSFSDIRLKY